MHPRIKSRKFLKGRIRLHDLIKRSNVLPTFYVLGAPKAGTTWLHRVLQDHPEIGFGRNKEVHFFDLQYRLDRGQAWYEKQFEGNENKVAIGDFTPKYLRMSHSECLATNPTVPRNAIDELARMTPDAKFIVILRNPVDRAISGYAHYVRRQKIKFNYPITKTSPELNLLLAGKYWEQLEIWFNKFGRDKFLILFYEEDILPDIQKAATLKRVCEFIGVDAEYQPDDLFQKFNAKPTSLRVYLLNKGGLRKKLFWNAPDFVQNMKLWEIRISQNELQKLHDYYEEPNVQLARGLGRELPW